MKSAARPILLSLGAVAILALPGVGVTAAIGPTEGSWGSSYILHQSRLRPGSRVTCSRAVFRGSLTVQVYSLKGEHASASARRCTRALAVVKAGRADLYSELNRSLGKRLKVQGNVYTLDGLLGPGSSRLTAAFVGAGTAVVAQFASGR